MLRRYVSTHYYGKSLHSHGSDWRPPYRIPALCVSASTSEARRTPPLFCVSLRGHSSDSSPNPSSKRLRITQCDAAYSVGEGVRGVRYGTTTTFVQMVRNYVLPKGYPQTVAVGFSKYYMWATASVIAYSFATTISMQALLNGFFVESTALTWMLKDILPHFLSSFLIGTISTFETRCKYWFLFSTALFQACVITEFLIAFTLPSQYLLLGGIVVALGKSMCFLISGITRATLHQHFATHQNLGDVTKCFNSIGLVAYTVSSALGLAFVAVVKLAPVQFTVMAAASCLALYSAMRAVSSVHMRILTTLTVSVLVSRFIQSGYMDIPSPVEVSEAVGLSCTRPPSSTGLTTPRAEVLINPKMGSFPVDESFVPVVHVFTQMLAKQAVVYPVACAVRGLLAIVLVQKSSSLRDILFAVLYAEYLAQVVTATTTAPWHKRAEEDIMALPNTIAVWEQRVDTLFAMLEEKDWERTTHCIDHASMRVEFAVANSD